MNKIEINTVIRLNDKPVVATTEGTAVDEKEFQDIIDRHNEKLGKLERYIINKLND